jgi:hypothetical protein
MKLQEIVNKANKGFKRLTKFRIYIGAISGLIFSTSFWYAIGNIKIGARFNILMPLSIFALMVSSLFIAVSLYTLIKGYKNQEKTSLDYPYGLFFDKKGVANNFDEIETLYKLGLVLAKKNEKYHSYATAFEYLDFNKKAMQCGESIPYEIMKDIEKNQRHLAEMIDKMVEEFLRDYPHFTHKQLQEIETLMNEPLEEVMKFSSPPEMKKSEKTLFLEKIYPLKAQENNGINNKTLSL